MKTLMKIIYPAFTLFAFACFAFSPTVKAVSPPPDGDYGGGNTAEGFNALFNLSEPDSGFNTAVGWFSLAFNVTGSFNTAVGAGALDLNTSHNNTAVGAGALALNTTGTGNTATGAFALVSNGTGDGNTALGAAALLSNTNGAGNTAVGAAALFSNIGGGTFDGVANTAVGVEALTANTTGSFNTAVGAGKASLGGPAALGSNTTGTGNVAVGASSSQGPAALGLNTTGGSNTAVGQGALKNNTAGNFNTAIGNQALSNLGGATPSPTPGDSNIAVGFFAGKDLITGSNNIYIGNQGMDPESNTIWIGDTQTATFIAGIKNVTLAMGAPVVIDTATGQLGIQSSSAHFKEQIRPMDKASETILALKPVSFRYKKGIDPKRIPQFGLVAEEVEKVNPDLIIRDQEGKPYTVRYEAVNAMLLNEFLKEHSKVEKLEATIAQQRKDFETAVTELKGQIQKVSAQLELSKAAPQTVVNNQ